MATNSEIKKLKSSALPLVEKEKTSKRLMSTLPQGTMFVGLCGPNFREENVQFAKGSLILRKVTNPPGIVHVCRAANLKMTDYLSVSRYAHFISSEIVVIKHPLTSPVASNLAYHLAALLKLTVFPNMFAPAYSKCSWDAVCGVSDNSIEFGILDDVPSVIIKAQLKEKLNIDWVDKNYEVSLDLRNEEFGKRFSLAFSYAYKWNFTDDPRIAIANIWCAIEALFGKKEDRPVTRKLVERVAAFTEFDPVTLAELYNLRCSAVHGRELGRKNLYRVITDSFEVLRISLIKAIEAGQQPVADETD